MVLPQHMPFQARIYNSPKRLYDKGGGGPGDIDVINLVHKVQEAVKKVPIKNVPLKNVSWDSFGSSHPSSQNGDGAYKEYAFSLSLRYFIEDPNRIASEYCFVDPNQHFVRVRVSGSNIDSENANQLLEEIIGVYDSFFSDDS